MSDLDAAGANWHLHIYANVKHGFTDPEADSHGLPMLGYDSSADRQSWAALLALMTEKTILPLDTSASKA